MDKHRSLIKYKTSLTYRANSVAYGKFDISRNVFVDLKLVQINSIEKKKP